MFKIDFAGTGALSYIAGMASDCKTAPSYKTHEAALKDARDVALAFVTILTGPMFKIPARDVHLYTGADGATVRVDIDSVHWDVTEESKAPKGKPKGVEKATEIPAPDSPEIHRMLALSTAHIKPVAAIGLDEGMYDDAIVYEKGEFGWFIPVLKPRDETDLPECLKACLSYADQLGCDWLMLDRDGETVAELPTYQW